MVYSQSMLAARSRAFVFRDSGVYWLVSIWTDAGRHFQSIASGGFAVFFLTFVVSYFKMQKKKCCFHKCGLNDNCDRRVFHFWGHNYTLRAEICGIDITRMKINSKICNLAVCEWHFTSEDYRMVVSPLKYSSLLRREAVPRGMFAYQLVMI